MKLERDEWLDQVEEEIERLETLLNLHTNERRVFGTATNTLTRHRDILRRLRERDPTVTRAEVHLLTDVWKSVVMRGQRALEE